ncbi:MAG TPA: hypothetical protein DD713_03135 [Nitrospiraceae bacterium]|nr:hypothetical protein [Nitrospiraceae bacterium]
MQYSIVNYSYVLNLEDFRFDADYYKPKYLAEDAQLDKFESILLGDCAFVTDGQHGYHEVDENSPILHLTAKNAKNWFADSVGADRLAKWVDDKNSRSSLQEDDLILSTRGTVGYCALVKKDVLPANIDQDVARIAIDKDILIPEYVLTFLNCTFGQDWLQRNTTGMVQQGLSLKKVRECPLPILDKSFQECIRGTVVAAYNAINESDNLFKKSQTVLLSELGLSNWQTKHQLSFVRNYSETDKAGRIDAEYFQPKYDEIVKAIKSYPGGYSSVGKEFKQNKSVFKPTAAQTYQYVEIGSINVATGEISVSDIIGAELPDNAKRVLRKDDVIVSKVRTYRGAMAVVDQDGLIGSGAFTVLRENGQINKETLLTFLRSKPLLLWSLKPNTGTSYPVILDDDILNLPIPLFSEETQHKVKQRITESFNLRKQSKHLLECAKRAVEIAIEQNEDAAIKWLQEQTKEVGSA